MKLIMIFFDFVGWLLKSTILFFCVLLSGQQVALAALPSPSYEAVGRAISPLASEGPGAHPLPTPLQLDETVSSLNPAAQEVRQDAGVPQLVGFQGADYAANEQSDVFGAHLFTGAFAQEGAMVFNPDYAIAIGDKIHVQLWGAFDFDSLLTVDPKGNVFLPHVGPVRVAGVPNKNLESVIHRAIARVFRNNVHSYASLAAAQPVRVFVSGFVRRPGLYGGTSMDSLLHYLDLAGGIDPERGSFLNIQVKRNNEVRITVNLYDFMLHGSLPLIQFSDGDVIFVNSRQGVVRVNGLAENAKQFEFSGPTISALDLMGMAKPLPEATHMRVVRNTGPIRNTEYYPLAEANAVLLNNGDEVVFTADKKTGTITVRVEGEHDGAQEYVLPDGSRLGDLLEKVQLSDRSDINSIQLFRKSVKDRQKQMLLASLRNLEQTALTARSETNEEAQLRTDEAKLLLQWVEKAKKVEPTGQVYIAAADHKEELILENGDVIKIPGKDGLVLVSGQVLFPNAVAYDKKLTLNDYIQRAGGYAQNAEVSRVVIGHVDGSFDEVNPRHGFFRSRSLVRPGDVVLVLPKVDVKSRQIAKDLSQILFQIAVTAKVALGL